MLVKSFRCFVHVNERSIAVHCRMHREITSYQQNTN